MQPKNSQQDRDREKRFRDAGFVFCRGFQSKSNVDELNDNLARLIRETVPHLPPDQVFYENKSDCHSLKQIQKLNETDEYFRNLMENGPFRKLAEELLASDVTCKNMQYFNKPPSIGLPTPPHQDGYYFKLDPCEAVTMWMALEPVDETTGCVRYIPGSHLRGMRPHGRTGTLGFSQGITDFPTAEDVATEISFPALPGDLLAHHALTIHRASGNTSPTRSRRAIGLIYYSVNAQQDKAAWKRYKSDLQIELKNSGKI